VLAAPGLSGFTVGSCVRLAEGYEEHDDAADGPLCRAHDVAVVLEASGGGARVRPIRLRAGDADVPYAPSMLRRASPAAADAGELREGDLVRAAPGAETYADLVRDALGAASVGVVVAAAVENTVTVRRLHEEGDSWYYEGAALEAAPTMAALRAVLAQPAHAPPGAAAAADAPLRLDQLVCLADSDDDDGGAWMEDSDAEGGDEVVNSRLRGGELGVVTRVWRDGVDARRLGTAHSCRYNNGVLTRPAATVATAAAAPFVVGERVVRRAGYRGPLPSTTRGARLLRGHVGIVAELTGSDSSARVRVTGHNGITLAYRPDALERAPGSRERSTPPDDPVPAVAVTLRAGMHGHPVGARNAEWPLMARYGGRCDVCSDETPASSAARCTLGCHFDLCAGCLAPELRGDGADDDDDEELSASELIAAHSAGGGASASAPTSAPFLALHEHTLAGLADAATYPLMRTFRGTLRLAWSCNVCSRRFSGADDRHRCTAGCDWDCCGECATTALLGLPAPPLQPGDAVVLAPGFASFGDAADGPLRPGDVGLVAALQPADRLSVQVLPPGVKDAANARAWWYERSALDPAPKPEVAVASSSLASADSSSGGILAPADSATSSVAWDFFSAPPAAGMPRAGDEQLPAARVEALRSRIVACALRGAAAADEEQEAAGMRAASAPLDSDEVMDYDDHDTDDDDDEDEDAEGLSEQLAVSIARDAVLRSSMWALGPPAGEKWRRPLRVIFTATTGGRPEEGVDGGGLTREWYAATSRALMRMPALVATANDNGEVYFNPAACSAADLQACEFLGAFLARALVEGSAKVRVARLGHATLGGVRLCDAFYKVLLGVPLTLADVADVSAPDARALRALLDAPRPEELCLGAFVHEVFAPGGAGGAAPCAVLPLRPGGANVPITRQNRAEYVLLKAQSLLVTSVAKQLDAACAGFFALVPAALLRGSGITPRQLRRLLCGAGDGFNVAELHRLARYSAPYSPRHRVIVWLWQTLLEGGPAMQCDFLEFVTGSPSPPANGFAALAAALPAGTYALTVTQVPLRGEGPALRLPQAHTCSCTLDLPPYESKDVLRERLLQALPYKNAYGFG
jgi:hypothetical protein